MGQRSHVNFAVGKGCGELLPIALSSTTSTTSCPVGRHRCSKRCLQQCCLSVALNVAPCHCSHAVGGPERGGGAVCRCLCGGGRPPICPGLPGWRAVQASQALSASSSNATQCVVPCCHACACPPSTPPKLLNPAPCPPCCSASSLVLSLDRTVGGRVFGGVVFIGTVGTGGALGELPAWH